MTVLEVGQVWSNGKTTRTIYRTEPIHDVTLIEFTVGNGGCVCWTYSTIFQRWINRTGATLQETKP
jgi:uncharacterized protein with PQ loop repeat